MTAIDLTRLVNTDQLKARIADELPISRVAEHLCDVELVRSGHQWKGCCPVHQEDTPSAYFNDGKGLWHCFGCKEGGDSIALVQQVHHCTFREAMVKLAEAAEIDITEYERPATPQEQERDNLRNDAERWLSGLMFDTSRVSLDTATVFGIVNGEGKPNEAPPYFKDKDYLFKGTIFPLRNAYGKLVGWKARHPDKVMFAVPSDFPLLDKSAVFGLDLAKPHIVDELIVVEGEWDCAVLYDHGIYNVVAMGGSKWTDEQMETVKAHKVKRLVFLLDGDTGGDTGAQAIARKWWRDEDIDVRIALCYPGSDPEDLVKTLSPRAVLDLVSQARGALEWMLRREYDAKVRETLSDQLDYVSWIGREFGEALTTLQGNLVLREIATWLGVPEIDVLDFVRAEKTPLQAPESEQVILGRAIRDANYYLSARKRLAQDDFFVLKHQRLWQVLASMLADGIEFDVLVTKRAAEAQGVDPDYVETLAATGDANIGWHEDRVIDFAMRRGAKADADRFRELIADTSAPATQLIGSLTQEITNRALGRRTGTMAISEQVDEAMEKVLERAKNPDEIAGISFGPQFPLLNRNMQGIQRRRLTLVAATSGRGKSTISLQWCANWSVGAAVPTDFISLEMDPDEILFKLASHITGIDSMKISGGALTPDEFKRVEQAMARIRKSPLRISAPDGMTPSEFVLYARESVMERRTEVFVFDYAQMVGPDPEDRKASRYEQLGTFAYTVKQKICRGLDTAVICCAQLKREAASKEEPSPEDMGDSYELVRAADVILLLNETDGGHEVWIGKNRQGPGQVLIPAHYDKPIQTYRESGGVKEPDYRM